MAPNAPVSVLLVDRDAPLARSVQILLEDEGSHNVTVATSAQLALVALAASQPFDVLIVDLAILDTHGTEFSRHLKHRRDAVAVIATTAHEAALDAAHFRQLDVAGFLTKPIDPGALLAMVQTTTKQRTSIAGERP